jgi:predicted Zn-dependent peptidase
MSRIGKAELVYGDLLSVDHIIERINQVSLDDVSAVAAEVLTATPTLAVVGPFDEDRDFTNAVA